MGSSDDFDLYSDDNSPQVPAAQPRYSPGRLTPEPRPGQPSVPLPPPPPPPPSPTGVRPTSPGPVVLSGPVRPEQTQMAPQPQNTAAPFGQPPQALPRVQSPQPGVSATPSPAATPANLTSSLPEDLHLVNSPNVPVSSSHAPAIPHPQPSINGLLKSVAKILTFAIIVFAGATLLNAFVFQTYYVNGHSMQPTLSDSDRLIVNKVQVTKASIGSQGFIPERGQIIVISSQVSQFTATRNEQIIKRVVALPGERITIERGTVTVYPPGSERGIRVDQELGLQLAPTYSNQPIDVTVPENTVYVLGDNRSAGNSYDSREFGPVSIGLIEGTLWVRVLPFDNMRIF